MAPVKQEGAVDWPLAFRLSEALRDRAIRERRDLREQVRLWKVAYWTVCAQFLVVCIAAVWGWAR